MLRAGWATCRVGLVLMRNQEGNLVGVSTFGIVCVSWILTVIFRPSPCIQCLQASTHIVSKLLISCLWLAIQHLCIIICHGDLVFGFATDSASGKAELIGAICRLA